MCRASCRLHWENRRAGVGRHMSEPRHAVLTVACTGSNLGGPSRTVPKLAEELAKMGTAVTLVTLDLGKRVGHALARGPPVTSVFASGLYWPRARVVWSPGFARTLRDVCNVSKPHVLHDNGVWMQSNRDAASVARELAIPLVLSPRGMLSAWALKYKSVKKRLAWVLYQRRCLSIVSAFHATSAAEAADIRACGLEQLIAVIPNAVALPPLWTGQRTKTILFMSRLNPNKGALELVDAWARARVVGWKLLVVGPDENGYANRLRESVIKQGLSNDVVIRDAVGDIEKWDLYGAASVFILPSHSENFGVVIDEALASGTPVITTDATPWRAVESEGCGWCVAPTVSALALAMESAMTTDPVTLAAMGTLGRKLIEREFVWERVGQQMSELYAWLTKGGRPPAFVC